MSQNYVFVMNETGDPHIADVVRTLFEEYSGKPAAQTFRRELRARLHYDAIQESPLDPSKVKQAEAIYHSKAYLLLGGIVHQTTQGTPAQPKP
tara:strand:+ start:346 stop:624 length:279 start_codon:yes stop_codon:yes gene_type:complete